LKRKIIILGSTVIAISIIVASIASNDNSTKENTSPDIPLEADVVMPTKVSRPGCDETDTCYIPSTITVAKGEPVVWVNEDVAFHSVTSGIYDSPTGLFDSGHMDPYQSFSFTFDESGNYDYYCTLHPWMKGQVIVE